MILKKRICQVLQKANGQWVNIIFINYNINFFLILSGAEGCHMCIFTGQSNQMSWEKTEDRTYEYFENIGKLMKEGDLIKCTLDVD